MTPPAVRRVSRRLLLAGLLVTGTLLMVPRPGPGVEGSRARAGAVQLISRGDPPPDTTGGSDSSISADGRYVVFTSSATNLVAGQVDAGGTLDVFLHDRVAGTTTLVSRTAASAVTTGNGRSFSPVLSADGRLVAFVSSATDLVAGQADASPDDGVFLHDRVTGTTVLVSRRADSAVTTGNGRSFAPLLSADGRFVVFTSFATDLVAGQVDDNSSVDVFLYDRVTGTTTLVSRTADSTVTAGDGGSSEPAISADGRFVAFRSGARDLVVGQVDTNSDDDVFRYDRVAGTTVLVSRTAASAVTTGDNDSTSPAISADGRFVAFRSQATDLVLGQVTASGRNVFLYDRVADQTILVSRTAASAVTTGDGESDRPTISANGQFVAFVSEATDLVLGQADTNSELDVFLYDRVADQTILVSRTAASAATTGNGASDFPALSAEGQFVAFRSASTDLVTDQVDANSVEDVFLYDRVADTTTLVSRTAASAVTTGNGFSGPPAISGEGQIVAFGSAATDLVAGLAAAGTPGDIFVYDSATTGTSVVSQRDPTLPSASAGGVIGPGAVSVDGRYVVYTSSAPNLVAGQVDTNLAEDVFLYDRVAGTTTLVSRTAVSAVTTGNGFSDSPVVSADGQFVAFRSGATDLVLGQVTASSRNVFLYDRVADQTVLVSRTPASAVTTGNAGSDDPVITDDGRLVAFVSGATDLVGGQADTNSGQDVFLYDRVAETTVLVSRAAASAATTGNGVSTAPVISADGQFVAFVSDATDLVAGQVDVNGPVPDVFLYDHVAGTTTLVSRATASVVTTGNGVSGSPVVSADGQFVAFASIATDLVAGQVDVNGSVLDVFLYDRVAGTTTLVSRTAASAVTTGSDESDSPAISADGRFVAFRSVATDLVAGQVDARSTSDVFLYDRVTGTTILGSRTAASAVTTGNGTSSSPVLSADGTLGLFNSVAGDLVSDDHNGLVDVFAFTRCPLKSSRTPGVLCREVSGGPGRSAPPRGAGGVGSR